MTTTGTTAFNLDLTEMAEEAYSRCGLEMRTGYQLRDARRSLNLLLASWANKGINLWTVAQGAIDFVAGTATYDLPVDCVDVMELTVRSNAGDAATQSDRVINRIAVPTYAGIPNKLAQGMPVQAYVNRQAARPTVTLWPVPDTDTKQLVFWYLRRLEDAGKGGSYTQDVPFRFLPALVSGLAYQLALKVGAMDRLAVLKAQADEDFQLAAEEDRDKASVWFTPGR